MNDSRIKGSNSSMQLAGDGRRKVFELRATDSKVPFSFCLYKSGPLRFMHSYVLYSCAAHTFPTTAASEAYGKVEVLPNPLPPLLILSPWGATVPITLKAGT